MPIGGERASAPVQCLWSDKRYVLSCYGLRQLLRYCQDVVREKWLYGFNLQSHNIEQTHDEFGIKHVVMQAPVLQVLPGTCFERGTVSSTGVTTQVVKGQNLRKMGEIVLPCVLLEILNQMFQCGNRPAVIEQIIMMRHDQYQRPARLHHTNPLAQCLDRVCNVLDCMGREKKIVRL